MKRLTTQLISSSKIITSSTPISGIQFTSCSSPISKSPIQNLDPYSNSNELFYKPYKAHQFYQNPSQNYTTDLRMLLENSLEVTHDRRLLGGFYAGLEEEHGKAVEEHEKDVEEYENDVFSKSPIYKNPRINLSNALLSAAFYRSMNGIRDFSTGVPSPTPSFLDPTDPKLWSCRVTRKIVRKFKSACFFDTFLVSPSVALPRRQIINVDTRFYKPRVFQLGMVSRSPEGKVLWAAMSRFDIDLLMPAPYKMDEENVDVNLCEMAALAYATIRVHEMRMSNSQFQFLVVTDNRLSWAYMGSKDNVITNKSHKFLALVTKKVLLYCSMRRLIWVKHYKNLAADGLSRARDVFDSNDEWMKQYYEIVEVEASNFNEVIEVENKKNGIDVEKGKNFEKELKECMRVIHK